MMRMIGPLALVGATMAGCAEMPRPDMPIVGNCAVTEQARMRFVGVRFHDVRREDIQRETNSRIARVLRSDDVATMDFREDRLNIMVDNGGQISGLRCG